MVQRYTSETPCHEQHRRWQDKNMAAFKVLLDMADKPTRIIEARGGMGYESLILQEVFPGVRHEAWERNDISFESLSKVEGVTAHLGDYPADMVLDKGTLFILDDNLMTLKYFSTFDSLFKNGAGQYIYTDLARGKIHLHPQAYQLPKISDRAKLWDLYIKRTAQEMKRVGLKFQAESRAPASITYMYAKRV